MALAISIPPSGLPFADDLAYVREAEDLGYESCWVAEVAGNDAFALGSAVATVTQRMRIGTAVVPVNTRGPAMLAMAASTMNSLSGGRGICGVGVSSPAIVSDWNGQPSDEPLLRARETIEALRLALSGEKVDYEGKMVRMKGYRMIPPPSGRIPVYLGALNKRMLRLGGELCDGVVVNMLGESFVPKVVAEVRKGAEDAGRDPDEIEIVMRMQCAVDEDPAVAKDAFAGAFASYLVARGYDRFFTWQGYGATVTGVRAAFEARDRQAARAAVEDGLLDDLVLVGDAATVRARLQAFMDAGITTPAVHAFWPTPESAWHTMRSLAPAR